ncbi:hypothetical protein REMIM1_CH03227 [Rhizobium etli bv. mimosae str. Mim1]|nr:hypothetical protein REMIM1_CH03227 [Rhizobium etli bv. mimosae str. Mim1]
MRPAQPTLPPATAKAVEENSIIFSTVEKFDVRDFFSCQHWTVGFSPCAAAAGDAVETKACRAKVCRGFAATPCAKTKS